MAVGTGRFACAGNAGSGSEVAGSAPAPLYPGARRGREPSEQRLPGSDFTKTVRGGCGAAVPAQPSLALEERPASQQAEPRWQQRLSGASLQTCEVANWQRKQNCRDLLSTFLLRLQRGRAFLRHRPKIKVSNRLGGSTSRSIGFCCNAHPRDSALKQRLLMLRGMPSLHRAMSASASLVNNRHIGVISGYPQPVNYVERRLFRSEGFKTSEY